MKLGYYNVDAMLDSAEAGQLEEWRAFYENEPFGDEWLQASVITSQIVNALMAIAIAQGGKKASESDLQPVDAFVPKYKQDESDGLSDVEKFARVMRNAIGV